VVQLEDGSDRMGLKPKEEFGVIKYGKLYTTGFPETHQRLCDRTQGYDFHEGLHDFDYLVSRFDRSFYDLPFFNHGLLPEDAGRPDRLSYKVYNDVDFWSYILLFNKIADPILGFTEGMSIKIPMKTQLQTWLVKNLLHKTLARS